MYHVWLGSCEGAEIIVRTVKDTVLMIVHGIKAKLKPYLLCFLVLLAGVGNAHGEDVESDERTVRIGVLARRSVEECLKIWTPTADYLSSRITGTKFEIVPLGYDRVFAGVKDRRVDFLVANPYLFVQLQAQYGLAPIATMRFGPPGKSAAVFAGAIVCGADRADIDSIEDLRGKSFVGVDEISFGGWIAVWREVHDKGIDPYRDFSSLSFTGSHDEAVRAVLDGRADAGSIAAPLLETMIEEGKVPPGALKVVNQQQHAEFPFLHSTRIYPHWSFARLEHVPSDLAESVCVALLGIPGDSEAAETAGNVGWTVPLHYGAVEECLKDLHLGIYKDHGRITFASLVRQYRWWIVTALSGMLVLIVYQVQSAYVKKKLKSAKLALEAEIVERKLSEERLRTVTNHNRLILESAGQGIFGIDRAGKVTFANPAAARMLQYEVEDLVGSRHHDRVHHTKADGQPYPVEECPIYGAIVSGRSGSGADEVFWRKDGAAIPIEYVSTPIMEHGEPTGAVVVFNDIGERLKVRARLQHLVALQEVVLENVQAGIAFLRERKFVWLNGEMSRMFGYGGEELLGKTTEVLYPTKLEYDASGEEAYTVLSQGSVHHFERMMKKKDGTLFWCGITGKAVAVDRDKVDGSIWILQDRSRAKRVQADLIAAKNAAEAANRAKSNFLANVTHELRTPLNAIIGFSELVLDERSGSLDEAQKEYIGYVRDSGRQLLAIVNDILEFARIESGVVEVTPSDVELHRLISDCVSVVGDEAAINDIKLDLDLGESPVVVKADSRKLKKAICSLLANAVKFTSPGGRIRVEARRADVEDLDNLRIPGDMADGLMQSGSKSFIEISISDSGIGIDESDLDRIFTLFEQGDNSATRKYGGTGLGLSLTRGLVEIHGGKVWAESEGEGRGSTFRMVLPS